MVSPDNVVALYHDSVGTVVILAIFALGGIAIAAMVRLWKRVVLR